MKLSEFVVIIFCLILGVITRRRKWLGIESIVPLNNFIIRFALPAVILISIPNLEIDITVLLPILTPWCLLLFNIFVIITISNYFKWSREVKGALLMVATLGNTSYLGFPLVNAFWGAEAMPFAVVYDQIGNFFLLAIYGAIVLSVYGSEKTNAQNIIKSIVSFPPFIALVLAFVIRGMTLPLVIEQSLLYLGMTMMPVAMFIVGIQLQFKVPKQYIKPLILGITLKMLIAPILVIVVLIQLDKVDLMAKVSVFESAVPPMVTAGIMAINARLAPPLVTAMIAYGTIAAFVTLPLLYALLEWLFV
ncbi:MAG: putative permease [Enterobacterales bacterium]|jgi:predicted permease